ncbi:hypothetical protein LR48_Vigan635s005100 [Vigna angularis]|uniref:Two-component response regulator-like APRR5 Pseudo-response regulator n=2 Tax=Phaseolus angularis TaxID=3914 RepID=A0A0L9TFC6_PHAAN|nr:two-component response regulator-like APRR5 isoform X1 [Vigna angularis]KAG2398354.1 Two-component response regulator-like APRR5 Pseudo-response regulator [Vigna angularis]KOM29126.1 hypothetical protein LR48_Vigan635s005100 [Vigna angularis]BAT80367.1 hypothetical protein VIGAN_02337200 [Vigna angularis var. angularis]
MGEVAGEKGVMQTQEEQSNNGSMVRWERFLPRMVLRVLLVEADDSTRQIIAALLRKCSYKVATACDGLKAWETLKNKASDIDLILTEVDLPSISGFSLLSLIMEHDVCKNIPVIMMSSHDSVSMVFRCMLKGAADFLIKPVRKNELRNLWQHVWRRHVMELGFAAENHAASNDSSGSVASTPKNNECSEKTSEIQDISQLKSSSNLSDIGTIKHDNSTKCERESDKHNDKAGAKSIFISEDEGSNKTFKPTGLRPGQGYDFGEMRNQDEVLRIELSKANPAISVDIRGSSDELEGPSTGAIDLIGTFKTLPESTDEKCSFSSGNVSKFDFDTQLELSIRRYFPGGSYKAVFEERQILNHSNASAFSRYGSSKLLQPLCPTPSTISAKLTNVSHDSQKSPKLFENATTSHQCGAKDQIKDKITTPDIGQSGQVDPKLPNSQVGFFPAAGVTYDHKSTGNGNVFPSMLYSQSDVHTIWTPKSLFQKESSPFPTSTSSQSNPQSLNSKHHHCSDDATHNSIQNVNHQSHLDFETQDSPAASETADTALYHDTTNHNCSGVYRSIGCTSDGNTTSAKVAKDNHESFTDIGHLSHDGYIGTDSHRTSQREAALTKFRLKRKDML